MTQPLILTLHLDKNSQAFYESLRARYFPPERNLIPAHLTLFHQLPDEGRTHEILRDAVQVPTPFPLTRPIPRSIGRGVAIFFDSQHLNALHAILSSAFQPHLIPQDRQRLRPHIVVQNKVDTATARATLSQLQATPLIEPHGIGFTLWRYLGGPWEHLSDFPFQNQLSSSLTM